MYDPNTKWQEASYVDRYEIYKQHLLNCQERDTLKDLTEEEKTFEHIDFCWTDCNFIMVKYTFGQKGGW